MIELIINKKQNKYCLGQGDCNNNNYNDDNHYEADYNQEQFLWTEQKKNKINRGSKNITSLFIKYIQATWRKNQENQVINF